MKLSVVSASLVSLALLTGGSFAATPAKAPAVTTHAAAATMSSSETGVIKLIDLSAHTLTLDNGKVFSLPKSWKLHSYKVGEKVKVIYKDSMGTMTVTKISKA